MTVNTSALTQNSNQISIGGLPFTCATVTGEYYPNTYLFIQAGFAKTGILGYQPLVSRGGTSVTVYAAITSSGNNYQSVTYNDISSGTNWIRVSGSYIAA